MSTLDDIGLIKTDPNTAFAFKCYLCYSREIINHFSGSREIDELLSRIFSCVHEKVPGFTFAVNLFKSLISMLKLCFIIHINEWELMLEFFLSPWVAKVAAKFMALRENLLPLIQFYEDVQHLVMAFESKLPRK